MSHLNHAKVTPAHDPHGELVNTLKELGHDFGEFSVLEALASLDWHLPVNAPQLVTQLGQVIDLMHDRDRPSLKLDALRLAIGLSSETFTMTGDRYGITREAVRQQVNRFRRVLRLPPCGRLLSDKERRPFAANGRRTRVESPATFQGPSQRLETRVS